MAQEVKLPKRVAGKARSKNPASKYGKGTIIHNTDRSSYLKSVDDLRYSGNTLGAIRQLYKVDGTVSSAVTAFVQIANTDHVVAAYDTSTHQFDPEGTQLARSILADFDMLRDYTKGYSNKKSVRSVKETLLFETVMTGGCAMELVLNKARMPDRLEPVSMSEIKWKSDGKNGVYPYQEPYGGQPVDLNIPTFFTSQSIADPLTVYPSSMLESSLTSIFMFDEFVEDVRKVLRKSGHSRTVFTLNADKVRASASSDIQLDPDKVRAYMDQVRSDMEQILSDIEPEEAIVVYDAVEVTSLSSDLANKSDYTPMLGSLAGILSTSLKVPPSILGLRLEGSQSLSNTESMVFLKIAELLHQPVETIMSRALTLACRLMGKNVYIKFNFKSVTLRPEDELQAFHTMRDQRTLERLSLGFITDEEAAYLMDTGPRAPDAPKLSGTFFHKNSIGESAQTPTPNADPQGRALQPDTPTAAGGASK